MSDFPEKIWVTHKEQFSGHLGFRASDLDHSTVTEDYYPEYIRADIVPQWQPIETMPDRPGQVFLSTPNMCYNVGTVLDQWVFLWKTKEPVRRDSYSHWMPIPKVPE